MKKSILEMEAKQGPAWEKHLEGMRAYIERENLASQKLAEKRTKFKQGKKPMKLKKPTARLK